MFLVSLKTASNGISLNSIAFRRPTHIYRSDSCPAGLEGYSNKGWAYGDGIYQKISSSVLQAIYSNIWQKLSPCG
jgi:hypothetical protein